MANLKAVGRVAVEGVLRVEINPVGQELTSLVHDIHADIALGVSVANGVMPVTAEQMLRYFVTALRTRVAHVTREGRFPIKPQDPWALPHVLNYIASAIGVVEFDTFRIMPAWNPEADTLVMSLEEQVQVTQQLRALKFRGYDFARALSSEREGHMMVMSLVHIGDEWVGHSIFTVADAIVAAIIGVAPEQEFIPSNHPLYVPAYRVQDREVLRYLIRLADVKVNRGVAQS